jgi:putative endonuclease
LPDIAKLPAKVRDGQMQVCLKLLPIKPQLSSPASVAQRSEVKGAQYVRTRLWCRISTMAIHMREHLYFVYMLASRRNGTYYIGVTNNIMRRTWEHKNDLVEGFTKKYGVHILVWYELFEDINEAIAREKRMKRWNRAWKIRLIEKHNSGWNDIYDRLMGEIVLPDITVGVDGPRRHRCARMRSMKILNQGSRP